MNRVRHATWAALAIGLLLGTSAAMGLDVEVGRASVRTVGDHWTVLTQEDKGAAYSGEVQGVIRSETRILLLGEPSQPLQSLLIVRASAGGTGFGYMQYSPDCSPTSSWHAKGSSAPSQSFLECYKIGQNWAADESLRVLAPKTFEALGDKAQSLPRSWTPIIAFYANGNGTFVETYLFVTPELIEQKDAIVVDVPRGLDPKFVHLAEGLMAGVRSSVRSISGNLPIPEMRFSPPPTSPKRLAQAPEATQPVVASR